MNPFFERRGGRALRGAAAAVALLGAAACDSLLDVDNPNNVNAEALTNPASAPNQVNGALAAITRGATLVIGHASIASDEMSWSGSLDGVDRINRGFIRDPLNEYVEDMGFGMAPARFMANRTVKQLEGFNADRSLADPTQLALANLYAALTYMYLGNHFDDFVIASDMAEAGDPVGADKMVSMFDSATAATTRALALVPASNGALRGQILAARARARFDRAIWVKLNPSGRAPADPLVNDQGATDDATAALPLLGSDGRLTMAVQPGMGIGQCFLPSCANSRREIRFNAALGAYNTTTRVLTVALNDPITGQPDPVLQTLMQEFIAGDVNTTTIVTSAREMRLILAEAALARGNTTEFRTQINALRALNQLPEWTGAAGQPSARDLLIHARRVNLYLQGRRLNDMYRFGIVDAEWSPQADTFTCPGTLFPISNTERLTNPKADASTATCGR